MVSLQLMGLKAVAEEKRGRIGKDNGQPCWRGCGPRPNGSIGGAVARGWGIEARAWTETGKSRYLTVFASVEIKSRIRFALPRLVLIVEEQDQYVHPLSAFPLGESGGCCCCVGCLLWCAMVCRMLAMVAG